MNRLSARRFICLAILGFTLASPSLAEASRSTIAEQLAEANCAVLVKWVSGWQGNGRQSESTQFEIIEVHHQPASKSKDVLLDERTLRPANLLQEGDTLSLDTFYTAKPGDLFLLTGSSADGITGWYGPLAITPACWEYIRNTPKPDVAPEKRLAHFALNLGSDDKLIASDALLEMNGAAKADVVRMGRELSRLKMRRTLQSCRDAHCRAWCIFLLGICGTENDVTVMEEFILTPSMDNRLWLDGLIAAYLELKGEPGLQLLEENRLRNKALGDFEIHAAMGGVRAMWEKGQGRIPPERLCQSMRILLDRPEIADQVIANLADMKDWSVQDRLIRMFDSKDFNKPIIKRAIIRFTLAAEEGLETESDDSPVDDVAKELPAHAIKAEQFLKALHDRDPEMIVKAKWRNMIE